MDVNDPAPASRPRYREGQVLCLSTLRDEQDYRIAKRVEHGAEVHDGDPGAGTRVVGATVTSPAGPWLALGASGKGASDDLVLFTLFVPKPGGGVDRCLAVAANGACALTGALRVTDASVRSLRPGHVDDEPQPRPWHWYRVPAQGDRGPLTRVELPAPLLPGTTDRSRVVVGWGEPGTGFVPLLTTDAGGNTAVGARLDVLGPVVHAGGPAAEGPVLAVGAQPVPGTNPIQVLVWLVNTSSVVITGLLVVITTRPQEGTVECRSLPVDPFLLSGQTIRMVTDPKEIPVQQRMSVLVDLFGVLPGGRLCHAGAVLRVP